MRVGAIRPLAAEPVLGLGLDKIARTPRPRLEVGYRILWRPACAPHAPIPCREDLCGLAALNRPRISAKMGRIPGALRPAGALAPLGLELYLDRLLAGGIVGEFLPLANERCEAGHRATPLLGAALDLCV